jgi:pimeloyl-ACP methyl ester carboxylesterase
VLTRRALLASAAALLAARPRPGWAATSGAAIDERGFVRIGGIDQWVAIQGKNDKAPAMLFLHGGPGEAESPFLAEFVPWESDYTVINWDQRGSGKTYGKNGAATPDMTVERMAQDAIEVAEHARKRLRQPKVVLVGHSWGAFLGLYAVTRNPDPFYALVATGQPINWTLTIEDRERWARQQATAQNDHATLQALNDTANLPSDNMKRVVASGNSRLSASDKEYLEVQGTFIGKPPYPTKGDIADWIAGGDFTGSKVWATITTADVRTLFPELPLPYFVIQGRDDHMVSFDAAKAYVAQVHAPLKAFVPIEGGHFACFTDSKQFLAAVHQCVDPLLGPAPA